MQMREIKDNVQWTHSSVERIMTSGSIFYESPHLPPMVQADQIQSQGQREREREERSVSWQMNKTTVHIPSFKPAQH